MKIKFGHGELISRLLFKVKNKCHGYYKYQVKTLNEHFKAELLKYFDRFANADRKNLETRYFFILLLYMFSLTSEELFIVQNIIISVKH